jgi:hypothetical protein
MSTPLAPIIHNVGWAGGLAALYLLSDMTSAVWLSVIWVAAPASYAPELCKSNLTGDMGRLWRVQHCG